jgi:hypothetical protein
MRKRDKKKEKAKAEAAAKKKKELYADVTLGSAGKRGKGRRQRVSAALLRRYVNALRVSRCAWGPVIRAVTMVLCCSCPSWNRGGSLLMDLATKGRCAEEEGSREGKGRKSIGCSCGRAEAG